MLTGKKAASFLYNLISCDWLPEILCFYLPDSFLMMWCSHLLNDDCGKKFVLLHYSSCLCFCWSFLFIFSRYNYRPTQIKLIWHSTVRIVIHALAFTNNLISYHINYCSFHGIAQHEIMRNRFQFIGIMLYFPVV